MRLELRIREFRKLTKALSKVSFTVSKSKDGTHTVKLFRKYRLFDCSNYDTASAIRDRLNNVLKDEQGKVADILKCLDVHCEQLSLFAKGEPAPIPAEPENKDEKPIEGVTMEEALSGTSFKC